jgi:long-chain acyl-CoA synthetase
MTSGTTGRQRAVPISFKNLIWTGEKFNEFMGISDSQKEMVNIPLTHSFGVRRIIAQMLLGGSIHVISGIYNPATALLCMKENNCSVLSLVPSQVRIFMKFFKKDFTEIARQINFIELSSEFMSPNEKKELARIAFNAQIVMGYGLTEATRSLLLHLNRNMNKIHTSGKPINGVKVMILDSNNKPVSTGNEGQIVIKGPNVVESYYKSESENNKSFDAECFFTGDLGFADEEGFVSITGRMDDIINVGGRKFNPIELELGLRENFPNVDCAISELPDNLLGRRPVLCIQGNKKNSKNIMSYIHANFESFKHPTKIIYLDEIVRTENGKIVRSLLKNKVLELADENS